MNDKIKNKNEPLSDIKSEEPEVKETEPVLFIDIDVYCDSLDVATNKFAKTIIQGAINSGNVPAGNRTREDWEAIYLKLKNS